MSPSYCGHMADTTNDDPRGPTRLVIAAGSTPATNHIVTLECGHKPSLAPHFHYTVGSRMRGAVRQHDALIRAYRCAAKRALHSNGEWRHA